MPDLTDAEFQERLDRAFDPHNVRPLADAPGIDIGVNRYGELLEAALAALSDPDNLEDYFPAPVFTESEMEQARAEADIQPITPDYVSRYDRAIERRIELEDELSTLDRESPRYSEAMSELAEVHKRINTELERATDDIYRERQRIDEYRATTGREEFNASRRDRAEPNVMTPKEVLAAETPEEKKERLRKRDSELKRKKRAIRKASEEKTK